MSDLIQTGAELEAPLTRSDALIDYFLAGAKPRSEWRYIGKDAAGYDLKDLCTGKGIYGQDTRMEGMLYATVMHPPVMGSTVRLFQRNAGCSR